MFKQRILFYTSYQNQPLNHAIGSWPRVRGDGQRQEEATYYFRGPWGSCLNFMGPPSKKRLKPHNISHMAFNSKDVIIDIPCLLRDHRIRWWGPRWRWLDRDCSSCRTRRRSPRPRRDCRFWGARSPNPSRPWRCQIDDQLPEQREWHLLVSWRNLNVIFNCLSYPLLLIVILAHCSY